MAQNAPRAPVPGAVYIPLGLRGHRVTAIVWNDETVAFELTPIARLDVGYGALFTPEPLMS